MFNCKIFCYHIEMIIAFYGQHISQSWHNHIMLLLRDMLLRVAQYEPFNFLITIDHLTMFLLVRG